MPVKTTIDKNAPILMQWIVFDPNLLKEQAEEGRHPLPNTKEFPHRQRLLDMAAVEQDRLICLYYLGDTLDKKQNEQMQELENLAPNIRAIDFNKLDWNEYDFEFDADRLTINLELGKKMKMLEYLKLPYTDDRMGFRLDMMRTLMLLKAGDGLIESEKVKPEEIPSSKSVIYFDFDAEIDGKIGKLDAPLGILAARTKGERTRYNYENSAIAVSDINHPVIINTYNQIKTNLTDTRPVLHKRLRNTIEPYLNKESEFDKDKFLNSILDLEKNINQYSSFVYHKNPEECNKKFINNLIDKLKNEKDAEKFLDIIDQSSKLCGIIIPKNQQQTAYCHFINNLEDFALQEIDHSSIENMRKEQKEKYREETELDRILEKKICLNFAIEKNGSQFEIKSGARSWKRPICYNVIGGRMHKTVSGYMYKDPELEIKNNISTNLEDVRQEQNKDHCR